MKNDKHKKLIEVTFPVKEVSIESSKEKNVRHGHISTLHIWWARRPLASSRATNYAALIPAPETEEELEEKKKFIAEFSKWENSLRPDLIEKARKDILDAYNGRPPRVLDPFGGGGAIPLEALRLGCDTYSNDYNPVAVLIQKCTLEYPQKYGQPVKRMVKSQLMGKEMEEEVEVNPLLEDVKKWGYWVLEETKKEIGQFYPEDPDGSVPVGYLWARTVLCQNPVCNAVIPLMRQYWLAKKENKNVSLFPYVEDKEVKFKIVGDGYEKMPPDFDPSRGTISQAVVVCPVCNSTIEPKNLKTTFMRKMNGEQMVAVVLLKKGLKGKAYRIASPRDKKIFNDAIQYLDTKKKKLLSEWSIEPIPDEDLPYWEMGNNIIYGFGIRLIPYGFHVWGDLFNSRQKLSLVTLIANLHLAKTHILKDKSENQFGEAVISYLALVISKLSTTTNNVCRWNNSSESIAGKPDQYGILEMKWDYPESNIFSNSTGSFNNHLKAIFDIKVNRSDKNANIQITQASADRLPFPDSYFDAIFTDPPYYDNIPYSYLSDFFYVWLKRSIGELHPDLFVAPVVQKNNEMIAELPLLRGMKKDKILKKLNFIKTKKNFEKMMNKAFLEMWRILKPNGIAVVVYAHKSTEGWETLINSLLDSNLVVTASWPLKTERKERQRAIESAALNSSIYIVVRKMNRETTGFYNDVKSDLEENLKIKLEGLWQEGIGGADYFIAAIGSAIEVFGKYEKVMDYEGNTIRADRLLEDVRKIATDYAVNNILEGGLSADISDLTRYYILFRWNYGSAKLHFDEARKLAQSCNIDLSHEWNRPGFIKKEKEFIKILGPQDRKPDKIKPPQELIDVLHTILLMWEKSKRDEMIELLKETGYGESDIFYKVAQAISETLPLDNKEKKLLDGFLTGKTRLMEETKKGPVQKKLFQ
jgi:adenine-specific DNA methylase